LLVKCEGYFEKEVNAGTNITVVLKRRLQMEAVPRTSEYQLQEQKPPVSYIKLEIGMAYQGGIIAYLDATGRHGLIAAPNDQSAGIQWYNGSYIPSGASATAIGTGKGNTNSIIEQQGAGNYAAKLCKDLSLGGYNDWYLPSKDELNELYRNRDKIGGFVGAKYWSSTGHEMNWSWHQDFSDGYQYVSDKSDTLRVRAVRSF
jgi:hypothetical protein